MASRSEQMAAEKAKKAKLIESGEAAQAKRRKLQPVKNAAQESVNAFQKAKPRPGPLDALNPRKRKKKAMAPRSTDDLREMAKGQAEDYDE